MRTLRASHRGRHQRKRDLPHALSCSGVSHHVRVTGLRPHTREYDDSARERLARAVVRAREAAGHTRIDFARLPDGPGKTSMWKLENGAPVSASVYEKVARLLPGWDVDTPRRILEGGEPPPLRDPSAPAVDVQERPPARYESEEAFFRAFIANLEKQGVPRPVIIRWSNEIAAELSKLSTERDDTDAAS